MSRALRVLHITPYYEEAWAYGGIPRLASALVRGLAARGHNITVCTTDACDRDRRLSRPAGATGIGFGWRLAAAPDSRVEIVVFPNVSNRLAYDWQTFLPVGLWSFLRHHAGRFDLAHLHACRNLPGVAAAWACWRAGVPFIVAPNGTAAKLERHRALKGVFDAVVGHRVLAGATRIVAVSEAERKQLEEAGVGTERIAVVPNPLDMAEFEEPRIPGRFRDRARLGRVPLVLFLGRVSPRKRVDVLVRAFADVDDKEAVLVIAGNDMGAAASVKRSVRESGVGGRALFTGLLEGSLRLDVLADADVVVYAGDHEVFGLVALEALLCGTPVVVADDSGCGEVIERIGGGLRVPPGDVGALTDAIRAVLSDRERWRGVARRAAVQVRAAFGASTVCGQLDEVYQDVAARR